MSHAGITIGQTPSRLHPFRPCKFDDVAHTVSDLTREESLSSRALRSAWLADSNFSQAIKVRKPCCTCSTIFIFDAAGVMTFNGTVIRLGISLVGCCVKVDMCEVATQAREPRAVPVLER